MIQIFSIFFGILKPDFFSIFGAEVIGIWPTDVSKNYINCCHLAAQPSKLATGDDDGAVKLYKFPCLEKSV
jgi:hypothetical protein